MSDFEVLVFNPKARGAQDWESFLSYLTSEGFPLRPCEACGGEGYTPHALALEESVGRVLRAVQDDKPAADDLRLKEIGRLSGWPVMDPTFIATPARWCAIAERLLKAQGLPDECPCCQGWSGHPFELTSPLPFTPATTMETIT